MQFQVNVALQVVPASKETHPYAIVDRAIEIIEQSGIRFKVCPFETVMEGDYDTIMQLIKTIQEECLIAGADSMLTYIKVQVRKDQDVTLEEKIDKYQKRGLA
jgi:uncharacterized protein (TIGR00106 family)